MDERTKCASDCLHLLMPSGMTVFCWLVSVLMIMFSNKIVSVYSCTLLIVLIGNVVREDQLLLNLKQIIVTLFYLWLNFLSELRIKKTAVEI